MEVSVTFEQGKMNSDIDPAGLPKGEHIESTNIDFFSGAAIPMKGMSALTNLGLANAKSLGKLVVPSENKIYNLYRADNDEGLYEYNTKTKDITFILRSLTGKLNLSTKIPKINLIDNFIFWSGDDNPPRRVDRTITYATDGFEEKDISVIKPAPLNAPVLVLSKNITEENNIAEKFLVFGSRFKYKTGETSAYSPFSKFAFLPENFDYNYSTHINNGMVNAYNSVEIKYDTGDVLVEEVQLLFKETGSNAVYLIDTFNKQELGYGDDEEQSYVFTNNKRHKVLPTNQLARMFDNVPLTSGAQEIIGNRLLYADYVDGYDFEDSEGVKIKFDYSIIAVHGTDATSTNPKESVKTDRDYEASIVYSDGETRMFTPIVSKTNTVQVPFNKSINNNHLRATIKHKAPKDAKSYRFFIKQSKSDYEIIIPSLFYEDGVFVWVKYEEADKDKINVGEYLIIKRDTSGLLTRNVEARILEDTYQEKNFLRPEFTGDEDTDAELRKITQEAGFYFKMKPERFVMNVSDLETLEDTSYHNTRNRYDENIHQEVKSISDPVLYGDDLDDVTSGGSYLPPATGDLIGWDFLGNQKDVRFKITIGSLGDSFTWAAVVDVAVPPSGSETIPQSGATFVLAYGVSVTFGDRSLVASWQYTPDEYFVVSAKTNLYDDEHGNRALSGLKGFEDNEIVEGGAQIQIWIKEYGGVTESVLYDTVHTKTSSKQYDNLEEWWHEDNISLINVDEKHVFFRRGFKTKLDNSYSFFEDNTQTMAGIYDFPMHIFIRGQVPGASGSDRRGKIASSIKIVQNINESSFPIFETKPEDLIDSDEFYELGQKTYLIDNDGNHLGAAGDTDQAIGTDAVIDIDFHNCYSFGNGVESYKIRDGFNSNKLAFDARVLVPIEDYKRTRNSTDFIYSGVFSKSTKVNRLNEFNLSTINFKELSTKQEGPIRFLATRKGDVVVFQQGITSKVLFGRTLLSSIDGTQIVGSEDVLGAQTFYSKKFGIGDNAESYAEHGNNFYYVDPNSATFVRGGYSGLDEIVNGQKNYFKDKIRCNPDDIQGVYDLSQDAYIASVDGTLNYYKETASGWTTRNPKTVDMMVSMNNRTFAFIDGDIYEFYVGAFASGSIKTVINDSIRDTKTFEALRLHSNYPLEVTVTSDNGSSTVEDYEKRENFLHADIPKSEISESNSYGIGSIDSINLNEITLKTPFNTRITYGDLLVTDDGIVGTIISVSGAVITVSGKDVPITIGTFVMGRKNSSIEGDTVRGALAILDIEFDAGKDHKLLVINCDIDKSFN